MISPASFEKKHRFHQGFLGRKLQKASNWGTVRGGTDGVSSASDSCTVSMLIDMGTDHMFLRRFWSKNWANWYMINNSCVGLMRVGTANRHGYHG